MVMESTSRLRSSWRGGASWLRRVVPRTTAGPFRRLVTCAAVLSLFAAYGCAGGRDYRMGREAEMKGDASTAYDAYCRAATNSRIAQLAGAIERVSREAADEAESAALEALDRGDPAEAWRLFMRTLSIQPSHPNAPQLIRRLEKEHPDAVAAARRDYIVRGPVMLAMAKPAATAVAVATPRTRTPPRRRAESVRRAESTSGPPPVPSESVQAPSSSDRVSERVPKDQPEQVTEQVKQRALEPEPVRTRDAVASSPPVDVARDESRELGELPPAVKSPVAARESPPVEKEPETVRERREPPPPSPRPLQAQQRSAYSATHVLSKKDRRYPRQVETLDGVRLRLEDTEGDLEVDIDVFIGKKRVKKIRDLELGRSQTFRGSSGALYRLTILGVHHKSDTVRLGIGPA